VSGIADTFARTVTDGPLIVAAGVAAVAGVVSFLSPCVLPLVPGYLSYVGGLSGTEATADPAPEGEGGTVRTSSSWDSPWCSSPTGCSSAGSERSCSSTSAGWSGSSG
jgi:cytochrome c-type biogenesis protein